MSKDTWLVNPAHYLETHGCPEQHLWLAVVERAFLDYADFYQYLGGNHNDSQRLRLLAEMKLPARAWLTFDVEPDPDKDGGSIIHQTVEYDPIGLWGIVYWYLVFPLHGFIFPGMIRNIARVAEKK